MMEAWRAHLHKGEPPLPALPRSDLLRRGRKGTADLFPRIERAKPQCCDRPRLVCPRRCDPSHAASPPHPAPR
jgi:hypothetical protein